jgi:iron complex outermembrane receptor protein
MASRRCIHDADLTMTYYNSITEADRSHQSWNHQGKVAKRSNYTFVASMTSCCLLSWATPIIAEASSSPEPVTDTASLEEVIVTARKHAENIQTVPVSVTALSGLDLRMQSVRTIDDLQAEVPSLFMQQAFDDPQSLTFTLRGRKQNDVTLAVDPAVGLYVDGLSIPRTLGMAGALVDIDRVEVLRGPQGTLYGRNTTGGAISLLTNNPTHELGGSLNVTRGNFGTLELMGIANIPLTNSLSARFVAQRGIRDGYGSNAIGESIGYENSEYYRAKLRWTPRDEMSAVLSAHYESNHSHGSPVKLIGIAPASGGQPAGGSTTSEVAAETGMSIPASVAFLNSWVGKSSSSFYDNGSTSYSFSDIRRWDVGLNVSFELARGLEFRSITGAQGLRRESFFGSPIPTTIFTAAFHTEDKYYSQEFQLVHSAPRFNWVVGAYLGYETGQDNSATLFVPMITPGLGINDSGIRNTNGAAFAQATWEFVPTWRVTAGARDSVDTRRADNVALVNTTCVVPAPGVESTVLGPAQCPRTFQDTFRQPTWLLSLDHQLTSEILAYVKAAKGYRSGGENEGGSIELATFAPFAPETNVEYEVGIKSEFLDHRVRFNVDAYHDKYKNLQVSTVFLAADGNFATAVTSAAQATIAGVEAESVFVITPHWTVRASAAFTDAHYEHFVDLTGDRSGEPFAVPRWTGSLSSRCTEPTAVGDLALQLGYNWKSATVLDGTAVYRSQVTQSAFGLLNARANLRVESWDLDVALFGKNITSQKYLDQANSFDSSFGVNVGFAGQPATYGVEMIKKF